jgi:rubrerythrin
MPNKVYGHFVEFEEKAAGIYIKLASRFSAENPALGALWLEMAMQEKQHAALLEFCRAERMFAPNLPSEEEIGKFSNFFRTLEQRAAEPAIDVDGAFLLAWELENSEVNAIYCHLTTPLNRSLYLLRRKIVTSPANHIDRLVEAGKKFAINPSTIQKLDELRKECGNECF